VNIFIVLTKKEIKAKRYSARRKVKSLIKKNQIPSKTLLDEMTLNLSNNIANKFKLKNIDLYTSNYLYKISNVKNIFNENRYGFHCSLILNNKQIGFICDYGIKNRPFLSFNGSQKIEYNKLLEYTKTLKLIPAQFIGILVEEVAEIDTSIKFRMDTNYGY
jgi:hypothetical protein